MKQQEVFKKIGTILKELNDQYEYLESADNQLNDLELELFVANAHFLADHSSVLRKLNMQNTVTPPVPVKEETPKTDEKFFEPVVQQAKSVPEPETADEPAPVETTSQVDDSPAPHIDLSANGADDDFSYIRPEPEVIKHELVLDESEVWEDEDDTGFEIDETAEIEEEPVSASPIKQPEIIEEPVKEPEPVKQPELAKEAPITETPKPAPSVELQMAKAPVEVKTDTATEEPLTINQMISAQLNKTAKVAEQLHAPAITDLKQAINLNDKLLYIKDLFNGYNLAYSEAIDLLNRFSTFAEAEDFLKTNYATKNNWDAKESTVEKFYALLKRRYS
ncbi:hypothetical protein [Mucilaginibacter ginsenosidivorans]|uniref:Uncharacterized protein n=1 Tax=Mucilaginibacter ginsenosidivorans TaxID=398053 RepID=A0A5B8V1L0_9SPHI|nr:hypothetical protein [Mucilaginibacter ginsenosidivorans]QEC65264.1 hypothetical protein FRZ54_22725 [Mucilaginibacter ginsenosidivorans]